jgi:hypothetical protein
MLLDAGGDAGGAQRVEEIEHHGADLVGQRAGRCKRRADRIGEILSVAPHGKQFSIHCDS